MKLQNSLSIFGLPKSFHSKHQKIMSLLEGLFIHVLYSEDEDRRGIKYQGIIEKADDNTVIIRAFSWLSGSITGTVLALAASDVMDREKCHLFASAEEMRATYPGGPSTDIGNTYIYGADAGGRYVFGSVIPDPPPFVDAPAIAASDTGELDPEKKEEIEYAYRIAFRDGYLFAIKDTERLSRSDSKLPAKLVAFSDTELAAWTEGDCSVPTPAPQLEAKNYSENT